jgi:methylglutaconyl-CoA hydratase
VSGLVVDRSGAVATVTLSRPERRNALDPAMIDAIVATFGALSGDDEVRVVVLAGAGPSFCAGADIRWMAQARELPHEENVADARRMAAAFEAVDSCPKAVVARVHGAAFGGGAGLVACADVAIAAPDTTFAFSEVRLGLLPATIAPYVLRAIGPRATRELFVSARPFGAEEARSLGLVHRVAADDELDGAVGEAVTSLLAAGPHAVAACKILVREATASYMLDDLAERIATARVGDESREGVAAFLEKRDPTWSAGS